MSLRAVTFDAAGTLIIVRWQPGSFAVDCLETLGIAADRQVAAERYDRLVLSSRTEYLHINATRNIEACRTYWKDLTEAWMRAIGLGPERLDDVWEVSDHLLYSGKGRYFELFEDAIPTLSALKSRGLKLAVISNWDYSLHRVLDSLGAAEFFDFIAASLLEGVEKPEKALFERVLSALDVRADETLHVGDDPLDDVRGGLDAGIRALLLDRCGPIGHPGARALRGRGETISSLDQILEGMDWTA